MLAVVRPVPGLLETLFDSDPDAGAMLAGLTSDVGWLAAEQDELERIKDDPRRRSSPKRDAYANILASVAILRPNAISASSTIWEVRDAGDVRNRILESPLGQRMRDPGVVIEEGWSPRQLELGFSDLMSNQRRVDIYDVYALPRLLDQAHGDFWHTLKWVGEQLAEYGAVGERPEVLIRGIVTANSDCPELQPVLRDRRVASGLAQRLRGVANDLTQASHAAFSIDVRIENGAAHWFHGRYLVLNDRWVVSSDRGFDFLTLRRGIASCRPNEFVRWFPRRFPKTRLSERYLALDATISAPLS